MSLQAALLFVRALRDDPALRRRVEALGPRASLDDIATVAREHGSDFTPDELRRAHAHDWTMRWAAQADRASSHSSA